MLIVESNVLQEILEAKRNELLFCTSSRDDIRIEQAAEDFDRLQQSMNRELAIRNLDRESKLLKSVEEPLARMETGEFGVCLHCEEPIPQKRPNALPWASHCVSCQEELDRRRAMGEREDDNDTFRSAA